MPTAQTCTITEQRELYEDGWLTEIKWDWSSTDAGAVVAAGGAGVGSTTARKYTGYVGECNTVPDAGGTTPAGYTITFYDSIGKPLATKSGASTTAFESHTAGHYVVNTTLNIAISGAGDAKGGIAHAYIKE